MYSASLMRNSAPRFNASAASSFTRSRPTSQQRPTDITFETGVEHETRMMVEHGRRSAQKQAYLAAGAGPPTSFHQVAARRRHQQQSPPEASFVGSNLVDSNVADLLGSTGEAFPRSPMRAVPAGRGLSREASSQNKFRDPGASSGAGGADDGFGLSGISLSSSMNLGERPPPIKTNNRRERNAMGYAVSGGGAVSPPLGADAAANVRGWSAEGKEPPVGPSTSPVRDGRSGATRIARAKEWNVEVENAYRLQEAGYQDETDALSQGRPPIERWPEVGFIRKLITKETLGKEATSQIYFSKKRECEEKDLNKIKLYYYD